jgi:hypothetical protein
MRELDILLAGRGCPAMCVSVNATELASMAILRWSPALPGAALYTERSANLPILDGVGADVRGQAACEEFSEFFELRPTNPEPDESMFLVTLCDRPPSSTPPACRTERRPTIAVIGSKLEAIGAPAAGTPPTAIVVSPLGTACRSRPLAACCERLALDGSGSKLGHDGRFLVPHATD